VVFVSSLTPPPPPPTSALHNLLALPHRLFFFAGVVQGLFFISLLGLGYTGLIVLPLSTGIYHVYALAYAVFTQFFIGFLLTTFPRYLSRPNASKESYTPIAGLINAGAILMVPISYITSQAVLIPMLLIFVGYAKFYLILVDFQQKSKVSSKTDTAWMLSAFAFGGFGQLLFMLDLFVPLYPLALGVTFYMYLFLLIMIVSQKMIPFFTANRIAGYVVTKSRFFIPLLALFLGLKVVLETFHLSSLLANAALFGLIFVELLRWKLPFRKAPPILWVLFLALWWAPIGFGLWVLEAIFPHISFEKVAFHALALGYFTTVFIGFGTRIILGHSGRTPSADGYATALFVLIQLMVLTRLLAGFLGGVGYVHLIVTSAGLWIVIFGLWSKRYIHMLFEK